MTLVSTASATRRLERRFVMPIGAVALGALVVGLALTDNPLNLAARNAPPFTHSYILGADQLGRSLLLQLCRASTITVGLGGSASIISVVVGFLLGLGSLANSRVARALFTVLIDLKSGLPTFFVALLFAAIFGQTPVFLFTALCLVGMEFSARATKASAGDFVRGPMYSALIAEAVPLHRRFVHVLLFISPVLIPLWALVFLEAILVESGLSFVGLGLRPELASLGVLIREAYRIMLQNPWPLILATTVLGSFCVGLFHFARRKVG